jgi:hypothetical protein
MGAWLEDKYSNLFPPPLTLCLLRVWAWAHLVPVSFIVSLLREKVNIEGS